MKEKKLKDIILFGTATICLVVILILAFTPRTSVPKSFKNVSSIAVFEDPSHAFNIETISGKDPGFLPLDTHTLFVPRSRSAWWIRVQPAQPEPNTGERFLHIPNASLEEIDVFFSNGILREVGKRRPVSNVQVRSRVWNIPIPEGVDLNDPIYICIRTNTIMNVPIEIVSASTAIARSQKEDVVFGLFFGILFALIAVNVFSLILLRRTSFAIYLAYLVSLLIYHLRVHGYLYFIPMPFMALEFILWMSLCGYGVSMMLFSKHFLSLKITFPVINRILDIGILFFAIQTVAGIMGNGFLANQIAYITGAIVPLVIIITAIIAYLKGFREARYYLLALIAMFSGTMVWSLAAFIEAKLPANYFFLIGTSIDTLLFTLAIFDKIRAELRGKDDLFTREQHYRELARTDTLTGLYNRRYLEEEVVRNTDARDAFGNVSLLIIDLDNFKDVNDTWGHLTGDMLLAKLGTRIKQNIRKSDIACRYGGDEFLVILSGSDISVAQKTAEHLLEAIHADRFYTETGDEIPYSISIGLSVTRTNDTFEGLFLRADAALYQSKKTGKNRLSIL